MNTLKRRTFDFDLFVHNLLEYKKDYGNLCVPFKYITPNNYKLGQKVCNIRCENIKLSTEEIEKLNNLGFVWEIKEFQYNFEDYYQELLKYKTEFGDLNVPFKYVSPSKYKLGQQTNNIKSGRIKTNEAQKEKLNEVGFVWRARQRRNYSALTVQVDTQE